MHPEPTQPDLRGAWWALAALRFLSELAMLLALAYTGWHLASGNQAAGVVLAVVLVALAVTVWGRFVAPRAENRLPDPARLLVELALFGVAVAGLAAAGAWLAGLLLAGGYALSTPVGRRGL